MNVDRLTRDLQHVGLSDEEASVYLRLLRNGPMKVGQLEPYFEMSRSKMYRLLDGLAEESIVHKSLEQPTWYEAMDPETVIRDRLAIVYEETRRLERLLETSLEPLQKLEEGEREPIEHHWTRIKGVGRAFEAHGDAAREADTRIWWTSTSEISVRLDVPAVDKMWKVASGMAEDGVDVRLLLSLPEQRLKELPDWILATGLTVRAGRPEKKPVDFMIIDDEAFLWASTTDDTVVGPDQAVTVRTNAPGVRSPLSLLFEELWSEGEPL